MKVKQTLLTVGFCSCLCGCALFSPSDTDSTSAVTVDGVRLNRIPGTLPVDIPQGLADTAVLDAVERAISLTKPGTRKIAIISQWRPELRDPENKWIRVGLTVRTHYLQVCWRIEGTKLIPDVPTSTNLKQDGTKIHRKVPVWINNLGVLISNQLYSQARSTARDAKASEEARND